MNNEQLRSCIEKLRGGDKNAFAVLYDGMKTPVFTIICRIVNNKELAEDVTHDLFVKLYQSPPDSSVKNPRAWIFKIARNLAINSKRRKPMDELNDNCVNSGISLSETIEVKTDIAEAFKQLSADELEIVSFHIYSEFKFREISEILHMPLGTVLWKYQKALRKLRAYMNGGQS